MGSRSRAFFLLCCLAVQAVLLLAADQPEVRANDNRAPAGVLREGVLTIRLEARPGKWFPEEKEGPGFDVYAFAEEGRDLQNPGPLVRVPEGTEIRATIRNLLPGKTLTVNGLDTRPGNTQNAITVPPNESVSVKFLAGAPGTYFYWGSTYGRTDIRLRRADESQLNGAFIVDPKNASPTSAASADRIFIISGWFEVHDRDTDTIWEVLGINGRSWPHTELLTYSQGETAHWRVINAAFNLHPMHLHGFYYQIESRGDSERDQLYGDQEKPLVVTDLMQPGSTMKMNWKAERPGNWVFHCHVLPHIAPDRRFWRSREEIAHAMHDPTKHGREGMSGLVLGIRVLPGTAKVQPAKADAPVRKLELVAISQPNVYGKNPGMGFALATNGTQPRMSIPGPPLVLTRGERVDILVRNQLDEPLAVHWHGIELDSYFDGVPGVSGEGARVMQPIPPGETFTVRFQPPRAGTFIYHTHIDDVRQLSSGLYGPLIVLEPGQRFDPETDIPIVFGLAGPGRGTPMLLNGSAQPPAMEMWAGTTYRLRLINIMAAGISRVSLMSGSATVNWRAVAKDGADLPPALAVERPALQVLGVGETADFEFRPTAGEYKLVGLFPEAKVPAELSPDGKPFVARPESRVELLLRVRERTSLAVH